MKQKQQSFSLKPRHILMCCFAGLALLLCLLITQTSKLGDIANEQQQLSATYDALQLEEQRLNRMLEYSQTDEYLKQYAREKLGYVGPDDFKFYRESPSQ